MQTHIAAALSDSQLLHELPFRTGGIFAGTTDLDPTVRVLPPTYMNDTVFPVYSPDAALLPGCLVAAAEIVVRICKAHGLAVNFRRVKLKQ